MQITDSPWGKPDRVERIGEGIWHVSTPSHGGLYVSPEVNSRIPPAYRRATMNGQGVRGWYEEDCDWSIVAVVFPEFFPAETVTPAMSTFSRYVAPKLSAAVLV